MAQTFNMNQFAMTGLKGKIAAGPGNTLSVQVYAGSAATAAAPIVPGDFVKLVDVAANTIIVDRAAVTDAIIGVVLVSPKKDGFIPLDNMEIAINGSIVNLESADAIARGADVEYTVSGAKVSTSAGTNTIVGVALDKASGANKLIRVLLKGSFAFSPTVTGGTINSTPIGGSAASTGKFTSLASTVTALTPAATISLNPALGNVFTLTPAASETINAASVIAGQMLSLVITTDGSDDFTLTLGTGFKSAGTLSTGTVTAKVFTLTFVSDGTNYNEVARTTAL